MTKRAILGLSLGALGAFFIGCQDGPSTPSAPSTESAPAAETPSALTAPNTESAPGVTSVEGTFDLGAPFAVSASGGGNWILDFFGLEVGNVLAFNAQRSGDGTVQGQWEYQQTFLGDVFRFHGDVTCIEVYDDGTRAKFGGPITRSNDPTIPVGLFGWWTVVDNGDGASGTLDGSSIIGVGDEQANEDFCTSAAPPNPLFFADVTSGNISVDG